MGSRCLIKRGTGSSVLERCVFGLPFCSFSPFLSSFLFRSLHPSLALYLPFPVHSHKKKTPTNPPTPHIKQLRYVLTQLGEKMSDEEVDELLKGVSVGADGNVNYESFVRTILSQ